jgi:hypothetical protein
MYTLFYLYDLGEAYIMYSVCSLVLPTCTQYVKDDELQILTKQGKPIYDPV